MLVPKPLIVALALLLAAPLAAQELWWVWLSEYPAACSSVEYLYELDDAPSCRQPDHGDLLGLDGDDHDDYLYLPGRSGGQEGHGGTAFRDELILHGSVHSSGGPVVIEAMSAHADNLLEVRPFGGATTHLRVIQDGSAFVGATVPALPGGSWLTVGDDPADVLDTLARSAINAQSGPEYTSSIGTAIYALTAGVSGTEIGAGLGITGAITALHGAGYRNSSADEGTLSLLRAAWFEYGHGGSVNDVAATTQAVGLELRPLSAAGTVTSAYGILFRNPATGGTLANSYGVVIDIPAGGTLTRALETRAGSTVFNAETEDWDFTVHGDSATDLLVVDASTDRVGIGTATPGTLLEVDGDATVTGLICTDCIQLSDLDDGANTPVAGKVLVVDTGDDTVRYEDPGFGPTGATGPTGDMGATGAQGPSGPTGPNFYTSDRTVNDSWSNATTSYAPGSTLTRPPIFGETTLGFSPASGTFLLSVAAVTGATFSVKLIDATGDQIAEWTGITSTGLQSPASTVTVSNWPTADEAWAWRAKRTAGSAANGLTLESYTFLARDAPESE